jgi:hypothetical protein
MEGAMHPKSVLSPQHHPKYEPFYLVPRGQQRRTIEAFYPDRVFDGMRSAGWFWWSCKPGSVPQWPSVGPFGTSYSAYRDAVLHDAITTAIHRPANSTGPQL